MKNKRIVQFAVMCLQAFGANEGRALSPQEISKHQGVPLEDCLNIIKRFRSAGIVAAASREKVILARPVEDLTAVEILEALWAVDATRLDLQMLVGGNHGRRAEKTLECVARITAEGFEING
ncbi:MAG: hypothetical protein A2992_07500 [Elusimicrobia bacterium RIFCSPLOWO2_01_FULL_59_12]|nr:MAG: hypothetical protein A2992_07500 [Elusimicrobia bacterium RIFCSPLOWO2_01_FULL_59_12]